MANAKKIIRIVGIILLSIGLIIIIGSGGYIVGYKSLNIAFIFPTIVGVFLFVIGLVFLMASRKNILAANANKIAGIVLLVIGSICLILIYYVIMGASPGWFIFITFIGVVCIWIPGLVLLLTSRKKNSKSPDKSIT